MGTLPFYEERALVGGGHMIHELGITKPAIRDDHRRQQLQAAPAQGRYAPVQHDLYPVRFVAA
jgi:hypothetical protein